MAGVMIMESRVVRAVASEPTHKTLMKAALAQIAGLVKGRSPAWTRP